MALSLFGRGRDTARDRELRELRLELGAVHARLANPIAMGSEPFVGYGDASNAGNTFAALRGTADSAQRVIRNRIQSLPMGVYVRRFVNGDFDDQPAFNHPMQSLLDFPTRDPRTGESTHSGLQIWGAVVTQYLAVGEAYLLVIRDGNGTPINLQITQPGTLEPLVEGGRITGYKITGQTTMALRTHDVVRIWDMDPEKLFTPASVMKRNATKINTDAHAGEHWAKFYQHDATPKTVFEATDSASPLPNLDQQQALDTSWIQRLNRRFGSRKSPPYILPGWKLRELQSQSEAANGVAMMTHTSASVMEVFGVSPSMLGRNVDVNRAAAETARYTFDVYTTEPITCLIADALTTQLAPQYPQNEGVTLVAKYKPFISRDKDFDLRKDETDLRMKVRNIDEVRDSREPALPSITWGQWPVGTFADIPYTGEEEEVDLSGFNLPPAEDEPEPAEVDDETPEVDETPEEEERSRSRELLLARKWRAHFTPEREWQRQQAREKKWSPVFGQRLRSVFARQAQITIERLMKVGLRSRAAGDDELQKLANAVFPNQGWDELFEKTVDPVRAAAFGESATAVTQAITSTPFQFTNVARAALELQNAAHITHVNETTRSLIVDALDASLSDGESVGQAAKRISDVFGQRKRDTRRIARTEMAGAVSEAQEQGYVQTGVVEKKQWNSSLDADVRDSHLIDGQTRDLDDDFTLGDGGKGASPGAPGFSASNRINCRCFLTPVFFDEDKAGLGFPVGAQGDL